MDFNEIFDNRVRKAPPRGRNYDVKITLNKSGNKFAIRFGFLNNAAEKFSQYKYIQFSNIEKMPGKIYFRLFEDKPYLNCYKLCSNKGKGETNRFATLSPTEEGEKIYRSKWVGKEFAIQFDGDHKLYFIDLNDAL